MSEAEALPTLDDWRAAADRGSARRAVIEQGQQTGSAPRAILPRSLHDELIDWSRSEVPNEACGLIAGDRAPADGGRALRFVRLRNAAASPYRYLIDPQEQLEAMLAIDDRDEVIWGIFHSHVASPAVPSPTDVGLAFYPDSLYLLCSLSGDPHVRAWTIRDGLVTEVPLQVD
jgi:[CysO sulfur-carrier protein]-S-L-cysteine hydrolase